MTGMQSINRFVTCLGAFAAPAFLLLSAHSAWSASCGLHCLRAQGIETPVFLELGASLRQSAIEYAGAPGTYSDIGFEGRYWSPEGWAAGLQWPLGVLDYGGATRIGMGNPMGFAEYRVPAGPAFRLDLGVQMGFPLGNVGDGLADDRFMGAFYAALTRAERFFDWNAALGLSAMLPPMESGHVHGGGGAAPDLKGIAVGGSHENLELLYRLGAKKKPWGDRTVLSLMLDGQHVLGEPMDPGSGRDFLTLEAAASFDLGAATFSPALLAPVSSDRRLDWGLSLRGSVAFSRL